MIHSHIDKLEHSIRNCPTTEFNWDASADWSPCIDVAPSDFKMEIAQVTILKGAVGIGKTAYILNLVRRIIAQPSDEQTDNETEAVFYISFKQPAQPLVRQLLVIQSGVAQYRLDEGRLNTAERTALLDACRQLRKARLLIEDRPQLTLGQRLDLCRQWASQHTTGLIVIDSPQLPYTEVSRYNGILNDPLTELLKQFKNLAKCTGVPVCILLDQAQYDTTAESHTDATIQKFATSQLTMAGNDRTKTILVHSLLAPLTTRTLALHYDFNASNSRFTFRSSRTL